MPNFKRSRKYSKILVPTNLDAVEEEVEPPLRAGAPREVAAAVLVDAHDVVALAAVVRAKAGAERRAAPDAERVPPVPLLDLLPRRSHLQRGRHRYDAVVAPVVLAATVAAERRGAAGAARAVRGAGLGEVLGDQAPQGRHEQQHVVDVRALYGGAAASVALHHDQIDISWIDLL